MERKIMYFQIWQSLQSLRNARAGSEGVTCEQENRASDCLWENNKLHSHAQFVAANQPSATNYPFKASAGNTLMVWFYMTHTHQWLPTYSLHLSLSKSKTRCDQLDMKAYFALWHPYSVPEISLFISKPSLNLHYLFPTCSLTSTPFSHLLWVSRKSACTLTLPSQGPSACSSHFLPWRRQFFLSHDPLNPSS